MLTKFKTAKFISEGLTVTYVKICTFQNFPLYSMKYEIMQYLLVEVVETQQTLHIPCATTPPLAMLIRDRVPPVDIDCTVCW